MKWITRARPKTDRIACPWLIRRFIDADAHRGTLVTTSDAVKAAGRSSGAEALIATMYRPA